MQRLRVLFGWLIVIAVPYAVSPSALAQDEGLENLRETSKAFASVARQVAPSVVAVQVERKRPQRTQQLPFEGELFRRFFGEPGPGGPQPPQQQPPVRGQGSGFVFASKGGLLSDKTYILTNNHVVAGGDVISVRFQDGREFDAKITGTDPKSDVAVIEIDEGDLPALELGDSTKLQVGEWVIALGNPFGLSQTLTVGVVSAKGRTSLGISDYEDFIQTDAAINPGNSGGPLVNLNGEVVGINTAIFSRSGGSMGVGFAIPSALAKTIANQLIETGEVVRGFLGVVIQDLTPELAESFDIDRNRGVIVSQVSEGTPAAEAGLQPGDVVVEYQGREVRNVGAFRNRVALTPPGTNAELTVIRDGDRETLDVTIGKLDDGALAATGGEESAEELGLTVQTITPDLARQFNLKAGEGVVVTEVVPGSIAARAGLQPGAVILQVDRRPVESAQAFNRAVAASRDDGQALLLVRSGNMQRYVVLNW